MKEKLLVILEAVAIIAALILIPAALILIPAAGIVGIYSCLSPETFWERLVTAIVGGLVGAGLFVMVAIFLRAILEED